MEERLRRRGMRIVHPQELALEEQIRLVCNGTTVIGLAGSALHLTVLRDMPGATTV
jgi:capsular polysaccharide biosynthesis protein